MRTMCVLLSAVAVALCLSFGTPAQAADDTALNQDQRKTLDSFQLRKTEGGQPYYTMDCYHDYKLDEYLKVGSDDMGSLSQWLAENVTLGAKQNFQYTEASLEALSPKGQCSSFVAETPDGKKLFAHNTDIPTQDSVLLIKVTPKTGYKSICTVPINWLDHNIRPDKELTPSQKNVLLATPYFTSDGINEKGVTISSMGVIGYPPTQQRTGKIGIWVGSLFRIVLDKAATTEEAIKLIQSYDLRVQDDFYSFHYLISDASGDSRVIEWHHEKGHASAVAPAKIVTNHRLLLNQPTTQNDSTWRYLAIEMALMSVGGKLSEADAMDILNRVSMDGKFFWDGWFTLWSVIYNQTDFKASFAVKRDYANPVEISWGKDWK